MSGNKDIAGHPDSDAMQVPGMAARAVDRLGGILQRHVRARIDQLRFDRSLRHLSGPVDPQGMADDVTVVALVRDGAYYLDVFLDHYRSLGVRHFVFCDTGSTDQTLSRLAAEPDASVLQSTLPWGRFENLFRGHAATRFSRGRWCLFADMDEILDFDGRSERGLRGLTGYLERYGYTAMMAQMLEMFPRCALRETADLTYAEAQDEFCHYDLTAVRSLAYRDRATGLSDLLHLNTVPDTAAPRFQFGGIRASAFGENCCLSKHPLVKVVPGVAPAVHPHLSTGVRVADAMAVLKHYKFANDPIGRDQASLASKSIGHGEDALRLAGFDARPDLSLWSDHAEVYDGPAALRAAGFLQVSARFVEEMSN